MSTTDEDENRELDRRVAAFLAVRRRLVRRPHEHPDEPAEDADAEVLQHVGHWVAGGGEGDDAAMQASRATPRNTVTMPKDFSLRFTRVS